MKWVLVVEAESGNGNEKWWPGYLVEETVEETEEEEERVSKRSDGLERVEDRDEAIRWGRFARSFVITTLSVVLLV